MNNREQDELDTNRAGAGRSNNDSRITSAGRIVHQSFIKHSRLPGISSAGRVVNPQFLGPSNQEQIYSDSYVNGGISWPPESDLPSQSALTERVSWPPETNLPGQGFKLAADYRWGRGQNPDYEGDQGTSRAGYGRNNYSLSGIGDYDWNHNFHFGDQAGIRRLGSLEE